MQEGFDGEAWKITPSSSMTERAKLERMCCFCSLAGSSAAPKTCLTVSQIIAAGIPDSTMEIVLGSGHMLPAEKPQELAGLVVGFLREAATA